MKSLDQKLNELTSERRARVEKRTRELIAEEMSLRDLRKALKKTQKTVAANLHLGQDGISRLEQRSDLMISTLGKYIRAMGGSLSLIAQFPNRKPIQISGLLSVDEEEKSRKPGKAKHATA